MKKAVHSFFILVWFSSSASADTTCNLPNCFLPKSGIPGNLSRSQTPQLVYFTFNNAINPINKAFYDQLFNDSRKNPNGCPIRATFMISHNYTVYSLVANLSTKGHECGSHSITNRLPQSWWEQANITDYAMEIAGQRYNIHQLAGVPTQEIRCMRSPYLAMGGDNQFTMLQQNNFTYDASMVSRSDPPTWPFTLQHPENVTSEFCSINYLDCPTKPYNLWELALNRWYLIGATNCTSATVDGCRPANKTDALNYLRFNFYRHYNAATKPPFGINMDAAWFQYSQDYFDAMSQFVDEILKLSDVWIVTGYKVLQWIQTPTPISKLNTFPPFNCTK